MAEKDFELVLIPKIKNPKVVGDQLKTDLDDLTKAVNADGGLKLDIFLDKNVLKSVTKQLTDLNNLAKDLKSMPFANFEGATVSTKAMSAATAEKLKQYKAAQDLVNAEKLSTAEAEKQRKIAQQLTAESKLRAQLEKEIVRGANGEQTIIKVNQQVEVLRSRMDKAAASWSKMFSDPAITTRFDEIKSNLDSIGGDPQKLQQVSREWQILSNNIGEAGLNTKSFKDHALAAFTQLSQWISITAIISTVVKSVRDMVDNVKELNTALTEFNKVADISNGELARFTDRSAASAKELSASLTDVVNATTNFKRLGYSVEDSETLGRLAIMYNNVGDEIKSIDDATASIISTMKAFNIEVGDAISIVDSFNEVGNNFAITSGGIGAALQRSAASLSLAGNSLSESVGLITGAQEIINNAERVGTMWNTVAMRIRGAKTELEEAGLETEFMAESTSTLRNAILGITNINGGGGFDILTDTGAFKSTYDIIIGIGEVWEELGKTDPIGQSALLELLAGKRQGNALAATFSNLETVVAATKASEEAAGSAQAEYERWQKSIEASTKRAAASWQDFSRNFFSAEFIKGVVDGGTSIIDVLNGIVKTIGTMPTIAGALGGLMGANKMGIVSSDGGKISQNLFLTDSDKRGLESLNAMLAATEKTSIKTAIGIEEVAEQFNKLSPKAKTAAQSLTGTKTSLDQVVTAGSKAKTILAGIGSTLINMAAFAAAMFVIQEIVKAIDQYIRRVEIAKEKSDELFNSWQESVSESQTLKDRLTEINDKITEINSQDKPLLSDENELRILQQESDELKKQIAFLDERNKLLQEESRESFLSSTNLSSNNKFSMSSYEYESYGNYGVRRKTTDDVSWMKEAIAYLDTINESRRRGIEIGEEELKNEKQLRDDLSAMGKERGEWIQQGKLLGVDNETIASWEYLHNTIGNSLGLFRSELVTLEDGRVVWKLIEEAIEDAAEKPQRFIDSLAALKEALGFVENDAQSLRDALNAIDEGTFDDMVRDNKEAMLDLVKTFPQLIDELVAYKNGLITTEQLQSIFQATLNDFNADNFINAFGTAVKTIEEYGSGTNRAEQATQDLIATIPGLQGILASLKINLSSTALEGITTADAFFELMTNILGAAQAAAQMSLKNARDELQKTADAADTASLSMMRYWESQVIAAQGQISDIESATKTIQGIFDSLGKSSSKSHASSSKSSSKDAHLEAYEKAVKEIKFLRDMDIISEADYYRQLETLANQYLAGRDKYIDQYRAVLVELHNFRKKQLEEERDAQIKAAKEAYDAQKKAAEESYKAQKKAAEDAYKAQKKALDAQKDALNDLLDGYKRVIDAQKQLLQREADSHEFENKVEESNKRIADIQADIDALSLDNSAEANAKRIKLQEDLLKEKSDLEEMQYDRSIKLQSQSLDDEYKRYKDHIDSQLKLLDNQLSALSDGHDRAMDLMESSHNAMLASMEASSNAFIQSLEMNFNALINEAVSAANQIAAAFEYAYAAGQSSSNVMMAQQQLVAGGYDVGKTGIDGIWGKNTEKAFTKAWQEYLNSLGANLVVDGIRGTKTRSAEQMYGLLFPTYHSGGVVGDDVSTSDKKKIQKLFDLEPNEIIAKLENGETVMTLEQMENLGGTLSEFQKILVNKDKLSILNGSANAMVNPLDGIAKATSDEIYTNYSPSVVIQQDIKFNGVDLADAPKMQQYVNKIAIRAKDEVLRSLADGVRTKHGFKVKNH